MNNALAPVNHGYVIITAATISIMNATSGVVKNSVIGYAQCLDQVHTEHALIVNNTSVIIPET